MSLNVRSLAIPDAKTITTPRFRDSRGYFCETFQRDAFAASGLPTEFIQDNQSSSDRSGTIRGLHFQKPPLAQAKLLRVLSGSIYDVLVDLRRSSPSFGAHVAIELRSDAEEQLFIPAGFAHGFCTLEPNTIVLYKVDRPYSAAHDGGINWADPALGIKWPVAPDVAILSDKDSRLPLFAENPSFFD